MQRVELPGLLGELFLDGLAARSQRVKRIYQDQRVTAWLHRMAPEGVAIATYWESYGWEFVLLTEWETPDLESYVFALADFEWSVILADRRHELHNAVLDFMDAAGLVSHEEQAFHYLQTDFQAA